MPLTVWVKADGIYTFSATVLNLAGVTAYLKDVQSDSIYDLTNTSPSFSLIGGQNYQGRFSVVFKSAVLSGIANNRQVITKIYGCYNTVVVNRNSFSQAKIVITNVLGQQIADLSTLDAKTEISIPVNNLGCVFVKVTEGLNSTVEKVLLRDK
jgi:hypothetical protein